MRSPAPPSGTTRYLCPLECGWRHDVPPPSAERIAQLGITPDPTARNLGEAIESVALHASMAETQQTTRALLEHLDTHTTQQFVAVIHDLRREVAQLREASPARPDGDRAP